MTHVHVAICCSWHVLVVIEFFVFMETRYVSLVLSISYDLIQIVGTLAVGCSSTCQTRFTSDRRNCAAHTSDEGCMEFAVTIMTIFRDLTIVNNDVVTMQRCLSTTEGFSTTEPSMMSATTEIQ